MPRHTASGVLLAQLLRFPRLAAGQPVVALAGVGLGLADPVAQGLLVDAQVPGDVRDRTSGGADLADRPFPQLVGVFAWRRPSL